MTDIISLDKLIRNKATKELLTNLERYCTGIYKEFNVYNTCELKIKINNNYESIRLDSAIYAIIDGVFESQCVKVGDEAVKAFLDNAEFVAASVEELREDFDHAN